MEHNDRNGAGGALRGERFRGAGDNHDCGVRGHEPAQDRVGFGNVTLGKPGLEPNVIAIAPAQFAHPIVEARPSRKLRGGIGAHRKNRDDGRLCSRCRDNEEQEHCDEETASHTCAYLIIGSAGDDECQ